MFGSIVQILYSFIPRKLVVVSLCSATLRGPVKKLLRFVISERYYKTFYVWISTNFLAAAMYFWQPMTTIVWSVPSPLLHNVITGILLSVLSVCLSVCLSVYPSVLVCTYQSIKQQLAVHHFCTMG